jgi:uncharacterized surface protein with fasciclin (FAS1) repeats
MRFARTAGAATVVAGLVLLGACTSSNGEEAAGETNPPTTTAPQAEKTIVDVASANPQFSTLVSAVKAAGLAGTLSGTGPYTVFAPTNDAFAALPAGTLDTLLRPENKDQLAGILTYHVVSGKVMANDVRPGAVKTVNGQDVTISLEGGNVILTDAKGNKAKVVTTDIETSNGVIHVIDTVLLPA